jgi:uncharacterized protein
MAIALITGASAGIGAVFARELASRGYDLLLVARRQDRLAELAQELIDRHGHQVETLCQDLTANNSTEAVTNFVADRPIDLLINNAGYGSYGEFTGIDRQTQLQMIQLNITALVDLTYQFLPGMKERGKGSIINVASIAAFQPMPYVAIYAATKAFVLSFSEALWAENAQTGVQILALCPGPTQTEFFQASGWPGYDSSSQNYGQATTPEVVVQEALAALGTNVSHVVNGGLPNRLITGVSRLVPREMLVKMVANAMQPKS